jgi:hypothetical protein
LYEELLCRRRWTPLRYNRNGGSERYLKPALKASMLPGKLHNARQLPCSRSPIPYLITRDLDTPFLDSSNSQYVAPNISLLTLIFQVHFPYIYFFGYRSIGESSGKNV